MALTRTTVEISFSSGTPGHFYFFTVVVDQSGSVSVRNILTPTGQLADPYTTLPQSVTADIQTAIGQVQNTVGSSSTTNGNVVFTAQASAVVTFSTAFTSSTYRVSFDAPDNIFVWATGKTTSGFTIQTSSTYTGTIGYDVFV